MLYTVATMQPASYRTMNELEKTHFWFMGKRLFLERILDRIFAPKFPPSDRRARILDVGCGTGGTTTLFTRYGTVTGLEQFPEAAALARKKGLKVVQGDANRLPFRDSSFDLVCFIDVLYHRGVSEPAALAEAYRVLRVGGTLIVSDCAMPWLMSPHDILMDAKYRYTPQKLRVLVRNAGFTVMFGKYLFASLFPFFAVSRLASRIRPAGAVIPDPPAFVQTLIRRILNIESSLLFLVPMPFGSSYIIAARKM